MTDKIYFASIEVKDEASNEAKVRQKDDKS
jgi:hypothetical protein